jgi:hypothetical protein
MLESQIFEGCPYSHPHLKNALISRRKVLLLMQVWLLACLLHSVSQMEVFYKLQVQKRIFSDLEYLLFVCHND